LHQKKISIVIGIMISSTIFGQESYLFSNDKYSGINAAIISPTQTFLNPNPWDVNLIAENVFVQNDYGYISQESILGLRNASIQTASPRKNITGENTPDVFDFYNKNFATYHFSSDLLGPSFSLKTKIKEKGFAFGLFSRLRTQTAAVRVDNYLRFGNQNYQEPEFYELNPVKVNVMNWAEFGFNFATEVFPNSNYQWIIGGNLKYGMGLDAVVVKSAEMELTRTTIVDADGVSKDLISAHNFDIEASYATNYNFNSSKYELKRRGNGAGVDLGLTFVNKDENSEDYISKISFNILDVGFVNFLGENHRFTGQSIQLTENSTFENKKFDTPQKILQTVSQEVYGSPTASFQGNHFTVGLPTSVNLNFSKNVGENRYMNANWIQRVPIFENSLKRSIILHLSYSVEKPVIGYGVSTSLYEYRNLQFGGYFRIGPLIIGSENALPLLFKHKKLHAADLYLALKFYPFWDNDLKRHRRKKCNCD